MHFTSRPFESFIAEAGALSRSRNIQTKIICVIVLKEEGECGA